MNTDKMSHDDKVNLIDLYHKVTGRVVDWKTRLEKIKKSWEDQKKLSKGYQTSFLTIVANQKPATLDLKDWNTFVKASAHHTVPQFDGALKKLEDGMLVKK
jgi:hypothetical protein